MKHALIVAAALALSAPAPVLAQDGAVPVAAPEVADTMPQATTVGVLHAAGYSVSEIATSPATDAAVVRYTFIMEHPSGMEHPLYMCRMMVGPGEEGLDEPLVVINRCERIE